MSPYRMSSKILGDNLENGALKIIPKLKLKIQIIFPQILKTKP